MKPFDEKAFAESMEKVQKARDAIVAKEGKARKVRGCIDCPVCGLRDGLRYAIAYNGHIHAACKADDCFRWME